MKIIIISIAFLFICLTPNAQADQHQSDCHKAIADTLTQNGVRQQELQSLDKKIVEEKEQKKSKESKLTISEYCKTAKGMVSAFENLRNEFSKGGKCAANTNPTVTTAFETQEKQIKETHLKKYDCTESLKAK